MTKRRRIGLLSVIGVFLLMLPLLVGLIRHVKNDKLIHRAPVRQPESTGNVRLVLDSNSVFPRRPELLVELSGPTGLNRLYYGVLPVHKTHEGLPSLHFDIRPDGEYQLIVHELKTRTATVQPVKIPPPGQKTYVYVDFTGRSVMFFADHYYSPEPYITVEQTDTPHKIL